MVGVLQLVLRRILVLRIRSACSTECLVGLANWNAGRVLLECCSSMKDLMVHLKILKEENRSDVGL